MATVTITCRITFPNADADSDHAAARSLGQSVNRHLDRLTNGVANVNVDVRIALDRDRGRLIDVDPEPVSDASS